MSNYEKNIHGRIREIRLSIKLSLTAFAKTLGFSVSYLSEVENGKTKPSLSLLYKISSLPKVDGHWLLTGKGEMIRKPEKEGEGEKDDTYIYKEEDSETASLLSMTREILKSDTDYSASLATNIRSFHHAIKTENRLNGMDKTIEGLVSEIKEIKQNSKQIDKIRESDSEIKKGEILKKRAM